jgi:hypothetical protein
MGCYLSSKSIQTDQEALQGGVLSQHFEEIAHIFQESQRTFGHIQTFQGLIFAE